MRKIQLIVLLLLTALAIQSCKKDETTTASTTADQELTATINGTTWTPDTIEAKITYNAAANTKTFSVVGTISEQRITINVKLSNGTNTNDFPLANYRIDGTDRVLMAYLTLQQDANDQYVYKQVGDVEPGSGSVTVTAVDTTKKTITGFYSFTAKKINYNLDGTIQSIETQQILGGAFNNMPYTFTAN